MLTICDLLFCWGLLPISFTHNAQGHLTGTGQLYFAMVQFYDCTSGDEVGLMLLVLTRFTLILACLSNYNQVISFYTLLGMWLLTHAGIQVNRC